MRDSAHAWTRETRGYNARVAKPEFISRVMNSRDAAFAVDPAGRIIVWNRRCEELFGQPARNILGRHCWAVLDGADASGNVYCYRNCPVTHQSRHLPERPVREFPLCVRIADEKRKFFLLSTKVVRDDDAIEAVVHYLREDPAHPMLAVAAGAATASVAADETAADASITLTAREKEILHFLAEGLTTTQIAETLFISRVTVRNHIQKILQKLGVHTKLAAVAFAYQHNLA